MKSKLIFVITAIIAVATGNLQKANAQTTWNLAGNGNGTASSKLGTTNSAPLRLFTNNGERLRITPSGLIGIGNTTPGFPLNFSTALGDKISLWGNSGNHYGFGIKDNLLQIHADGDGSDIAFGYGSSSNFTERMRIKGNGKVCIGTINPEAQLDVAGNILAIRGIGQYGLQGIGDFAGIVAMGTRFGITAGGDGESGIGVYGYSGYKNGIGVQGRSTDYYAGNFESENGVGIKASTVNGFYAGMFSGNIVASGYWQGSDKNLKKNIQDFENAMSIINKLKPKYYEFSEDAKFASLNLSKGNHYGLIAQEVEEVLPHLVKESKHELGISKRKVMSPLTADRKEPIAINGRPQKEETETKESMNIKAVNYIELIPIIIKGIQEQQAVIEKQQQQIDELKQMITQLSKGTASEDGVSAKTTNAVVSKATLEQNNPNPFTNITSVRYNIPAGAKNAQLVVTDNGGKAVKQITLNAGTGVVNIDASGLTSGIYNYTLLVNGKTIESKKMVVAH